MKFFQCKDLDRKKIDIDETDNSPARVRLFKIEVSENSKGIKIETDEEYIRFSFSNFEVFET